MGLYVTTSSYTSHSAAFLAFPVSQRIVCMTHHAEVTEIPFVRNIYRDEEEEGGVSLMGLLLKSF